MCCLGFLTKVVSFLYFKSDPSPNIILPCHSVMKPYLPQPIWPFRVTRGGIYLTPPHVTRGWGSQFFWRWLVLEWFIIFKRSHTEHPLPKIDWLIFIIFHWSLREGWLRQIGWILGKVVIIKTKGWTCWRSDLPKKFKSLTSHFKVAYL